MNKVINYFIYLFLLFPFFLWTTLLQVGMFIKFARQKKLYGNPLLFSRFKCDNMCLLLLNYRTIFVNLVLTMSTLHFASFAHKRCYAMNIHIQTFSLCRLWLVSLPRLLLCSQQPNLTYKRSPMCSKHKWVYLILYRDYTLVLLIGARSRPPFVTWNQKRCLRSSDIILIDVMRHVSWEHAGPGY